MYMPAQIQLKTVKTVEIEPEKCRTMTPVGLAAEDGALPCQHVVDSRALGTADGPVRARSRDLAELVDHLVVVRGAA